MSRKRKTRNNIIQSSIILFVENGYDGTTMDQISEYSGVSKSTIYYSYFKSKLELVKSILIEGMTQYLNNLKQISFPVGMPTNEIARQLIRKWFAGIKENESYWKLFYRSLGNPKVIDAISNEYYELYLEYISFVTDLFKKLGKPDPESSAALLLATIDGLLYQSFFFAHISDLTQMEEKLFELFGI